MTSETNDLDYDLPDFADSNSSDLPLVTPTSPSPHSGISTGPSNIGSPPAVTNREAPGKFEKGKQIVTLSPDAAAPPRRSRWQWMFMLPSWFISLALHLAVLLTMAAYSIEPIKDALTKLVISSGPVEDVSELESFEITSAELSSSDLSEQTELTPIVPAALPELGKIAKDMPAISADVEVVSDLTAESLTSQIVPGDVLATKTNAFTQGLTGRTASSKRDLLEKFGGGTDTEKAVAMGLKWLVQHQLPDGSWSFEHTVVCNGQCGDPGEFPDSRNAATGLALMAFFGAGQTHLQGDYKSEIFKGLSFLINRMEVTEVNKVKVGSWFNDPPGKGKNRNRSNNNRMYAHGICTIAVCEAYGMTNDPDLAQAAQLGINFAVAAQDPVGGGWRYFPGQAGDTSVVGWYMMALKSAWMSHIIFPNDTVRRANFFLNTVQLENGAGYAYLVENGERKGGNDALRACGVLCRMYLGTPKDDEGMLAAVEKLQKTGPQANNAYLNYYATQVMKQYGGKKWEDWNEKIKKLLLGSQEQKGHAAGSWKPIGGRHDDEGGRLYTTAMSVMVLEVYYRYLPIYHEQTEEDEFKL